MMIRHTFDDIFKSQPHFDHSNSIIMPYLRAEYVHTSDFITYYCKDEMTIYINIDVKNEYIKLSLIKELQNIYLENINY